MTSSPMTTDVIGDAVAATVGAGILTAEPEYDNENDSFGFD